MYNEQEKIEIESLSELLRKSQTDDGTFYGCLYNLYVLIGIAKGIKDINSGNSISLDELYKEMEALHENTSRKSS